MKRILILLSLFLITIFVGERYIKATLNECNIAYTILDEEGNEIENGVIHQDAGRAAFAGITLKDGQMAEFKPDNAVGFLLVANRIIKFTYSMNAKGYMTTQLYRFQSVRVAKNQSILKGTTLQYTTTTRGYYYALITNDSGSDKNIYGITFTSYNP